MSDYLFTIGLNRKNSSFFKIDITVMPKASANISEIITYKLDTFFDNLGEFDG